ncbi:MAG: GlsB/YeaQ/YmgE family stress response membrane protein [Erysipelotrichales bacterium]|nr:GlsB/YeaQ/YmgE family stress response membrane protein [Erysipelotrichales bacterium]MBQ4374849.1 GlsB/YeaQ/YmgE family stress response membrane protein [Erysipelotrichales bacterium]MBQ5542889.1 GlsB/YeaQ/YmgE family stress response membrane protein [Erysipelotrichales bacterium]
MLWWLICTIAVGCVSGFLASKLMGLKSDNWVQNLVIGLIGSFVGGLIGRLIGLTATNLIGSVILSVIGACVALWAYNKFIKK